MANASVKPSFDIRGRLKICLWEFLCLILTVYTTLQIYSVYFNDLHYRNFATNDNSTFNQSSTTGIVFWSLFFYGVLISILLISIFNLLIPYVITRYNITRVKTVYFVSGLFVVSLLELKMIFYCKKNLEMVNAGFNYIKNHFADRINDYFDTDYYFSMSNKKYESMVLFMVLIGFITLTYLLTKILKRQVLVCILPIALVIFLMVVGLTPGFFELVLAIALIYIGFNKRQNFVGLGVLVVIVALGGLIFTKPANMVADKGYIVKRYQDELLDKLKNMFKGDDPTLKQDTKLSSSTPSFNGENLFRVVLSSKPSSSLYFRVFIGNEFKNSNWTYSPKSFDKFCTENRTTDSNFGYKYSHSLLGSIEETTELNANFTEIGIYYENNYDESVYSYLSFIDKDIKTVNDYLMKKSKKEEYVSFNGYNGNILTLDEILKFFNSKKNLYSEQNNYYKYVKEHYTHKSDNKNIAQAANIIKANVSSDPSKGNVYVYEVCEKLRAYFNSNFEYSLDLKKAPKGVSYLDYFMSESKQGFCMHFATAGTLILQEMGVPARYASGYIAPSGYFEQRHGAYFETMVEDYNGHAWVEVYFDNIGWLPVEVTPGYFNSGSSEYKALPTKGEIEVTPTRTVNPSQTVTPTPDITKNPTSAPSISPTKKPTSTASPIASISPVVTGGNGGNGSGSVKVSSGKTLIKVLSILLILVIIAMIVLAVIKRYKQGFEFAEKAMKKGRYSSLVNTLNKKIYRRVRARNLKAISGDVEYAKLLNKYYPSIEVDGLKGGKLWAKYMQILSFVSFSGQKCSEEDAKFVYDVYLKIRKK